VKTFISTIFFFFGETNGWMAFCFDITTQQRVSLRLFHKGPAEQERRFYRRVTRRGRRGKPGKLLYRGTPVYKTQLNHLQLAGPPISYGRFFGGPALTGRDRKMFPVMKFSSRLAGRSVNPRVREYPDVSV
jgi:hypothetical protein